MPRPLQENPPPQPARADGKLFPRNSAAQNRTATPSLTLTPWPPSATSARPRTTTSGPSRPPTADDEASHRLRHPYIQDKTKWPHKPDVMFYEFWPVRSPALLFAGLAFNDPQSIALWKTLEANPTNEEVIRNVPIRNRCCGWSEDQAPPPLSGASGFALGGFAGCRCSLRFV